MVNSVSNQGLVITSTAISKSSRTVPAECPAPACKQRIPQGQIRAKNRRHRGKQVLTNSLKVKGKMYEPV
jgi:hypothetical protein